jgi:hypothetical protein
VRIGQVLRGSFTYNRMAADANPDPDVGEYHHFFEVYGMHANADALTFTSDPAAVSFLYRVVNGTPDEILVQSGNNLSLPAGHTLTTFEWQLTAPSGNGVPSEEIPAGAPNLADWTTNELRLGGEGAAGPAETYLVTAEVIAVTATPCSDDNNNATDRPPGEEEVEALRTQLVAVPSPLRGATTFRFAPRAAERPVVRIYDVGGRRVRTLLGQDGAAVVEVMWDGKDDAGRRVARGLYTARVGEGRGGRSTKIVVMGL